MNRLSMVWIVPTVMGMLALTVSGSVRSQEVDTDSSKWNFSTEDKNTQLALAETGEEAVEGVDDAVELIEVEEEKVAQALEPTEQLSSGSVSEEIAEPEIKRLPETAPAAIDKEPSESLTEAVGETSEPNTDSDTTDDDGSVVDDEEPLLTAEEQTAAKKIERTQTRYSLDQQFKKLQKTLETADAYNLELAEDYFGYGLLLRDNGQYDEALEAFVDALHIQKVNHGIYSPEQRPALKALFETHYSLGNVEDFEDYLERILWVESKNPDLVDDFSYKMLIMVGNRYIDQFLRRPVAGQGAVQTLLRAKHHLNAAFSRHRDKPLSVALMPYGELALISFLENQLRDNVDQTASMEDPRLRGSRHLDGRELALSSYLSNSFPRGTGLLKSYLRKAQREENLPHVVRALISLGDFNQLFRRNGEAAEYYKLAWAQAQNLAPDHELLSKFATPLALPAFDYAIEREPVIPTKPTLIIPLTIDIGSDGRVTKIVTDEENTDLRSYYPRARRIAKRTIFRPAIVDGEPQASTELSHETRVYARKGAKKVEEEKEKQK